MPDRERTDRERLDWLEAHPRLQPFWAFGSKTWVLFDANDDRRFATFREAVDAAMAAEESSE